MLGDRRKMTDHPSSLATNLTDSIMAFGQALEDLGSALKECRKQGMSDLDIRDTILQSIPEEDHAAFLQQWPMLSMMFAVL
jgi:hypothetical protein